MDVGLRLFLLLIGVFIVVGLIWDFRRNRLPKKEKKLSWEQKKISQSSTLKRTSHNLVDDLELGDDFLLEDEIISEGIVSKVNYRSEPSLPEEKEEVIILNVMAKKPYLFSGQKLLEALAAAHLSYGEMQIFHRHQNIDGTGTVVFSLASAIEPGYFEISKIESYQTPGLTLFFTTTRPNQSIAAFELMLRTAKQLAELLEGEVKDDKHRPLTIQAIEVYRDKIRGQHRVGSSFVRAS